MSIAKEKINKAYLRINQKYGDILLGSEMSIVDMDEHEREKFLYATVMFLTTAEHKNAETLEDAEALFEIYDVVITALMALTPEQFERMFPIEKTYDGDRWEVKDYYFTKKIVDSLPKGEMLYKNVNPFEFMWDYCNKTIRFLLVKYMGTMSEIRKFQGLPSLFEEYFCQPNDEECSTKAVEK